MEGMPSSPLNVQKHAAAHEDKIYRMPSDWW